MQRLTLLAQSRLSPRLAARSDPEDVVLSAWRSFFVAARSGRFTLRRSGDLWRLLAAITMHKLYRQARRATAEVHNSALWQPWTAITESGESLAERQPTPEEAIALADELEQVLGQLEPFEQRVLELRMQETRLAEIAAETGRSERTVRRALAHIRELLAARFDEVRDD